jgi:hypothetical protein
VRAQTRTGYLLSFLLSIAVVASGMVVGSAPIKAEALSGSEFNPGNIISDGAFYDANAMTEAQIQDFLVSQVGSCANANCLAVATVSTATRPADAMCAGSYAGAAGERTATIIYKVQKACGISAKVLLVTLQKEQGLITNRAPSSAKLDRAMGYGCPDNTAQPGWCDPAYGGLYNQIYRAAWQFKRYGNPPGTSNHFNWYPVGGVSAVRYHPNAACGSSPVLIQNKATAALYYYTPYQPNASALANLGGVGDGCASYGNRNFWVYYNNWFGSGQSPFGNVEVVTPKIGGITFTGWAIDPETAESISVHLYVDGVGYGYTANKSRPDVGAAFPQSGAAHGFTETVPASGGFHQACVYAINVGVGANSLLGCSTVYVPGGSPIGEFASVAASPGMIDVTGWVIDPDVVAATSVHVYVDSTSYGYVANEDVPRLATAYPGYGSNHGFSESLPATAGRHTVCIYGINVGYGANTLIGCKDVTVPSASPFGALESATAGPGGVTFTGWTVDPSAGTTPLQVHIYVDSLSTATPANKSRADIAARFPEYGPNHGFSATMPATAGQHRACAYGINVGPGENVLLGCLTVVVPDGSPVGTISSATAGPGAVNVTGWALDPDVTDPIYVHVYVDGASVAQLANQEVPALATSHPGKGTAHGFTRSVPATAGPHNVCVYGINVASGSNALIGCRTVTVPSDSPFGSLDTAAGVAGGIQFTGWAIDPSTTDPIPVHLYVDSASHYALSDVARSDVGTTYPAFGPNHGFAKTVPATPGTHRVCAYGINVGPGSNTLIGCKDVVVPGGSPIGQLTDVVGGAGAVTVTGWALDPDVVDPITVHVYVDSRSYAYTANVEMPSLATSHPGQGTAHAFTATIPTTAGSHRVCLYGINVSYGANTLLECRSVTVTG